VAVTAAERRPRNPSRPPRTSAVVPRASARAPTRTAGGCRAARVASSRAVAGARCGWWSRSAPPAAGELAPRPARGPGCTGRRGRGSPRLNRAGKSVVARRCLGGSHPGPPISLRQRRGWAPNWRRARRYAHPRWLSSFPAGRLNPICAVPRRGRRTPAGNEGSTLAGGSRRAPDLVRCPVGTVY
jgi:hypothetical protein